MIIRAPLPPLPALYAAIFAGVMLKQNAMMMPPP